MSAHRLRRPDAQLSADLLAQAHAQPEPERHEWRDPRPEGWTMAEMRRVARLGSARIRRAASSLVGDAVDIAWEGVAIAVTLDPHCSWADAAEAAYRAVADEASEVQHVHRLPQGHRSTGARSAVYWGDWLDNTPPSPEGCVERMAFGQVWAALTGSQRGLLMMASVMHLAEMSRRLGVSSGGMSQQVRAARRAAISLWHDWEAPPVQLPPCRTPRERPGICPRGHAVTTKRYEGGSTQRYCATCRKERSQRVQD